MDKLTNKELQAVTMAVDEQIAFTRQRIKELQGIEKLAEYLDSHFENLSLLESAKAKLRK